VLGRHPERDLGGLDLALGPHQPLGHGRLGNQEGAGDLGSGQAAERPQGERVLRVNGQRRAAAGEDELEPLVGEGRGVHLFLAACGTRSRRVLAASVRSRRMRLMARLRVVTS
jgi:hypothetical protein